MMNSMDRIGSSRCFRSESSIVYLLLAFGLLLLASGCVYVEGSGVALEEEREVAMFSEVSVSGAVGVYFTVDRVDGEEISLTVSGDDNLVPYVKTRVEGDRLYVETKGNVILNPTLPLMVSATVPRLDAADLSGSTSIIACGISSENFSLDMSGSSQAELAGRADGFLVDGSGSMGIEATDLYAREAYLDLSGSSSVKVCAEELLDVDASGSAEVAFTCDPESVIFDGSGSAHILELSE